jgi:hypothetical protein
MSQVIFRKAIEGCMPLAIPVNLEKAGKRTTGHVFMYSKKPHKVLALRGMNVTDTEESFFNLLAKNTEVNISLSRKVVLGREKAPLSMSMEVSGDAELQDAIAALEGFKSSGKVLHIRADFGEVIEASADLVHTNLKGGVKVDPSHYVVKRAIEYGGAMFIINTTYKAEHCKVAVRLSNEKEDWYQQEYTEGIFQSHSRHYTFLV